MAHKPVFVVPGVVALSLELQPIDGLVELVGGLEGAVGLEHTEQQPGRGDTLARVVETDGEVEVLLGVLDGHGWEVEHPEDPETFGRLYCQEVHDIAGHLYFKGRPSVVVGKRDHSVQTAVR